MRSFLLQAARATNRSVRSDDVWNQSAVNDQLEDNHYEKTVPGIPRTPPVLLRLR